MSIAIDVPLSLEDLSEAKNVLQILGNSPWYCKSQIVSDHLEICGKMLAEATAIVSLDNFDQRDFHSRWHYACLKHNEYRVHYNYNIGTLCIDLLDVLDPRYDDEEIEARLIRVSKPGEPTEENSNFEAIDMADELAGGPEWDI